MKLGTETGSVVNHLYSRAVIGQPEPEVGMGVTMLFWTDRAPGTIQRVFKIGKNTAIEVTFDASTLVSGSTQSESQEWQFTEKSGSTRMTYMRKPNGTWKNMVHKAIDVDEDAGRTIYSKRWSQSGSGAGLRIGKRDKYIDPCF
jgi:hypothetical protein